MNLRKVPKIFWPPISIAVVASLIALGALFLGMRNTRPISTSIDLRANATTLVEFTASNDAQYVVEIEMDQQTAKRLFPCAVDLGVRTYAQETPCPGIPLELEFQWKEDGVAGPRSTYSAIEQRGGSYGGRETYSLSVGYRTLKAGGRYALSVKPTVDATFLLQANPRLVIGVSSLVLKEEMVSRFLALTLAAVLIVFAAIWAALAQLVRFLQSRQREAKAP